MADAVAVYEEIHIYMSNLLTGYAEIPYDNTGGDTFVRADSTCFRDLVQRLTGLPVNETTQRMAAVKVLKKPAAKLHERRKLYARPKIEIAKPATSFKSNYNYQLPLVATSSAYQVQSPSPSSILQASPVISCCSPAMTPYSHSCGSSKRTSEGAGELLEDMKAAKEKRFYLHTSPGSKTRLDLDDDGACIVSAQPKLLSLFPLTSPTAADSKFS